MIFDRFLCTWWVARDVIHPCAQVVALFLSPVLRAINDSSARKVCQKGKRKKKKKEKKKTTYVALNLSILPSLPSLNIAKIRRLSSLRASPVAFWASAIVAFSSA